MDFHVTDSRTGKEYILTGDTAPTEDDLNELFGGDGEGWKLNKGYALNDLIAARSARSSDLRSQMAEEQRNQAVGTIAENMAGGGESAARVLRDIFPTTSIPMAAHAVGETLGLVKQPFTAPMRGPEGEFVPPFTGEQFANQFVQPPKPEDSVARQTVRGTVQSIGDLVAGLTQPEMAATMLGGGPVLQAAIAGQMTSHFPDDASNAGTTAAEIERAIIQGEKPDYAPFARSVVGTGATGALAAGPVARGTFPMVRGTPDPTLVTGLIEAQNRRGAELAAERKAPSALDANVENLIRQVEADTGQNRPAEVETKPVGYETVVKPTGEHLGVPSVTLTEDLSPTLTKDSTVARSSVEKAGYKIKEQTPEAKPAVEVAKPAESVPVAETNPVSERVKLKSGPQTYTVVDRPPATSIEKELGESTVRIKNEKTGENQVVNESQVQAIKPKPAKWTSATADDSTGGMQIKVNPKAGEAGFVNVGDIIKEVYDKAVPAVKRGIKAIKDLTNETLNLPETSDIRRSLLNWSSRHMQSYNEAAQAQKEITHRVPNPVRREGITNWIQADGDKTVLADRAKNSSDPKRKAGYEAALNLTPDEIALAGEVKTAFDALGQRGLANEVLSNFRDNYAPQIWDLNKGPVFGGSKTLRENFRFSKARTFDSFFDGEQAGFIPKTKDISKLLPVYLHEMNSVIAARNLVQEMSKGKASDGLPLIRTRGAGVQVDADPAVTGSKDTTLILPDASKPSDVRYQTLDNQPALHGWKWVTKDQTSGRDVLMKGDLELHPEAYARLKKALGKSAIQEWYNSPGSIGASIPKALFKGLDNYQSITKQTMLGMVSPFHQVQEGTHAIGHRINPFFNIPKIDLVGDAAQIDATKHGLMLAPDRMSANQFMDGLRPSGLVSKIPLLGKVADMYSEYLFHQYIPGLKFKTYQSILERNNKVYEKELASGAVKPEDVKILSSEQANAAYGHLNYTDLGRNPTMQHIARLGLLAPDFLEARGRFAGQALKGATGSKVGREQMLALATLALAQATLSYTSAKLSGGEWDEKHPFEFHVGDRRYTMRSVPEDAASLVSDWRRFMNSRLSPVIMKSLFELGSGVDWKGHPITTEKVARQAATQFVPINLRGFEWIKDFTGESRPGSLSVMEQLASSAGLKVSRYSAQNEVSQLARDYRKANNLPTGRFVSDEPSEYAKLRNALLTKDDALAIKELAALKKTKNGSQIWETFGLGRTYNATGSLKDEAALKKSLNPQQLKLYDDAVKERESERQRFLKIWAESNRSQPNRSILGP